MSGRRLLTLVIVLAAIGIPAGLLQAACVGRSCDAGPTAPARIPFCPLPDTLKALVVNGYREGRSPDVLGVVRDAVIATRPDPSDPELLVPWPSLSATDARVPIAFSGLGIATGASVPDGTTLDAVAPTVAAALGFERPFPDVRSGSAVESAVTGGESPTLVLLVAWKGVGTVDLETARGDWPFLRSMLERGAGTLEGSTGSLPLDPAATLTTIGTGGLPSQHGITGSFVRSDAGEVLAAFGAQAPVPVIATLADDLDAPDTAGVTSPYRQRPEISIVETSDRDRGLIGGDWYERHDADTIVTARGSDAISSARAILESTPDDGVPDVLGVVLDGSVASMDRRTAELVRFAERTTHGRTTVALAGTGTSEGGMTTMPDGSLVSAVEDAVPGSRPAVAATVGGGVFLDQAALTQAKVTGQVAVDALLGVTDLEGREMMADAFQGFAVSFARYC